MIHASDLLIVAAGKLVAGLLCARAWRLGRRGFMSAAYGAAAILHLGAAVLVTWGALGHHRAVILSGLVSAQFAAQLVPLVGGLYWRQRQSPP